MRMPNLTSTKYSLSHKIKILIRFRSGLAIRFGYQLINFDFAYQEKKR